MAFERLSISVANPSKFVGSSRAPVTPGLPTLASRNASNPSKFVGTSRPPPSLGVSPVLPPIVSKPPVTGGTLPPFNPPGNTPVTGGDLPPLVVAGKADNRTKQQRSADLKNYMQTLAEQGKLSGTLGPLFALVNYRTGATPGLTQDKAAGGNKPGGSKPPATPTPQWAFKPNALDQPSYVTPMGNAAAYTINPPAQQWMFDPATYGQGAPPQWYGQPVVPNSQPPFRY